MTKLSPRFLCQIYLLLALLAATILSPLPYLPLSLILLFLMLFITFRPFYPGLNATILVATIFLLPQALELVFHPPTYTELLSPTIVQILAVITILPAIYLLDYNLRQNAQNMTPAAHNIKGRHITTVSQALFASTLAILVVSLLINNPTLLFTSIALILYLLVILIRILLAIPRLPLDIPAIRKRIIAGTTADIPLHPVSKASIRIHSSLSPVDSWVKTMPQRFTLNGAETELNLTITPPLAGPLHPQLQTSVIDPWGFTQINQVVEPVELHVIPRARYAEWLAMKYLEQAVPGVGTTTTLPPKATRMPKRGTEYYSSRTYQPGDPLVHIDWKRSLKLNQIIVKEYIGSGAQAVIIAVNLSVTDAEEADKLAFNLITTALTLAHEAIPTALAVYNNQKVVLTTPAAINPRETIKHALSLVKDITLIEFAHRFLQPPDIGRLRRNITLLKQATSEPAQRLHSMLSFEFQALEKSAKNHPATLALSLATEHISPPAIIIMVTQFNHDVEALLVTADKLSKRGFTTIPIEATKQQTTSSIRSEYGAILSDYHELPAQ